MTTDFSESAFNFSEIIKDAATSEILNLSIFKIKNYVVTDWRKNQSYQTPLIPCYYKTKQNYEDKLHHIFPIFSLCLRKRFYFALCN